MPSNLWVAMNNVLLLRNAYHYSTNFPPSRFSQVLFGTPGSIWVLLGTQIYLWLALNHVLLLYKPCTILPFSQVLLGTFGYLLLLCWWVQEGFNESYAARAASHYFTLPKLSLAAAQAQARRETNEAAPLFLCSPHLPRLTAASE